MANKEKKTAVIDEVQESLTKAKLCIMVDYRGLTALEVTELRKKLRESGVEFRVVKNTLARFAAERSGKQQISDMLKGPMAIAFGYGDGVEAAKTLSEYKAQKSKLEIKGGLLGAKILSVSEVSQLTKLPSRDMLIAQVVGGIQGPIVALVSYLSSPLNGLAGVLQARIKQMEAK